MRRAWLCVVLVAAAAGAARADDEPSIPRSVDIALDHGRAHLTATWRWKDTAGVRSRRLRLLDHMLVTAARFRAGGDSHELVLTDRQRADKQLLATQNLPVGWSPAGAIELTTDGGYLEVDFLLPATGEVELVVDLDAPTCFAADTRYVRVPGEWPLTGIPEAPSACSDAGAWSRDDAAWIAIPTQEASALPVERIAPRAAAMVAGGRQYARIELVRGSDLTPIPLDLYTVIVVDHSRSLTANARAGENAVLAAYASEVPHSQLAVVAFSRAPSVVAPWGEAGAVAPAAIAALDRMPLANGSNLLRGIAAADALLAHASGTRRVIVLSDDQFADSLTADRLAAAARRVRTGTIIHTVAVWFPGDRLVRDDHSAAAPLAATAEGEPFVLEGGTNAVDARPLLRPERLEDVELELGNPAAGWTRLAGPAPDHLDLASGEATTWWFAGSAIPRAPVVVTLNGRLWGRRWHAVVPVVRADRDVARAALTDLDDDALRDAAAPLAKVVDDRHALYTWWGGTGGYRIELEEVGIDGGVCGCDSGGGAGGALQGVVSRPAVVDGPAVLEAQLRAAIGRCALTGASGTLHVELTGEDEIVDVAALLWGGRGDRAAAVHCIEEAVWATQVHVRGAAQHSSLTLRL